ncbi:hypothetical protein EDC01DRAFT_641860 [Geopyxis carbonaria]|nr:hypothetical protein EDC01DRAFT_641860 [Geopyxis carbonaria]
MPLESAYNNDAYASSSQYEERSYPKLNQLPMSRRFTEENRTRFINMQIGMAEADFGFRPTSKEREALSYYNGYLYTQEAYGAVYGWTLGLALGSVVAYVNRKKTPWRLISKIGNKVGMSRKFQDITSQVGYVVLFSQAFKAYFMTYGGLTAFKRTMIEQKEDPTMQRYLEMRKHYIENPHKPPLATKLQSYKDWERLGRESQNESNEYYDEQSLGGLDVYDEKERRNSLDAAPSTLPQPSISTSVHNDDDPFGPNDSKSAQEDQQSKGSAWDRLRRGEAPAIRTNNDTTKATPRNSSTRRPMNGRDEQSKQDSFSFSNSESERKQAKEEAQREFDEQIERERQGRHGDDFTNENSRR